MILRTPNCNLPLLEIITFNCLRMRHQGSHVFPGRRVTIPQEDLDGSFRIQRPQWPFILLINRQWTPMGLPEWARTTWQCPFCPRKISIFPFMSSAPSKPRYIPSVRRSSLDLKRELISPFSPSLHLWLCISQSLISLHPLLSVVVSTFDKLLSLWWRRLWMPQWIVLDLSVDQSDLMWDHRVSVRISVFSRMLRYALDPLSVSRLPSVADSSF